MAPTLKLTYFDMRGRAEPARLAMLLGKVDYEDDRIGREEWAKLKPNTPYGSFPVLKVDDDIEIAQSNAILRYVGKLSGLYPSDGVEAMFVDEVLDTMSDIVMALFSYRGEDKEKVKQGREKFITEAVPRYWHALDKRITAMNFGGDGPYVLGDRVSVADVAIVAQFNAIKQGIIDHVPTDCLDGAERMFKMYNVFMKLPEVVEWYKKHPIPNVTE